MRVDLGTIEVTEEERKAIKLALGFKAGRASRHETREFALAAVGRALEAATRPDPEDLIRAAELEER